MRNCINCGAVLKPHGYCEYCGTWHGASPMIDFKCPHCWDIVKIYPEVLEQDEGFDCPKCKHRVLKWKDRSRAT